MEEGKAAVEAGKARSATRISVEGSGRTGRRPGRFQYLGRTLAEALSAVVCVGLAEAAHQDRVG